MNENDSLFENKEKLAKNKLIILYIMHKIEYSLSNSQLLKLLYDFEGFNYYYFQHILSDLVEQKYIINYQHGEEWLYKITPSGSNVLELTQNILPGIIKYKLDTLIENLQKNLKHDVTISAEYIPENGDAYITKCKVVENHKTLFELNIYCVSQEQAKIVSENWKNNAIELYPQFIELLTQSNTSNTLE